MNEPDSLGRRRNPVRGRWCDPLPYLALYLPLYAAVARTRVFNAPLLDIALQAVVQGLLTAVVELLLYGRMVRLLGATRGAAFVALTPVMTGLMGIPVLGEWPIAADWVPLTLISISVYVVSGGRVTFGDSSSAY